MKNSIYFLVFLAVCVFACGCTSRAPDPVIGNWTWSDGKGYVEHYTYYENHSFSAKGLGSEFSGTWNLTSPDHYVVTYWNNSDTGHNETLTETAIYDSKTDEVFFPAHVRVK